MDAELHLYDLVMIGQKELCSKELFESKTNSKKEYKPADEEKTLKIIRYAFKYYMNWTPDQALSNINWEILKDLKVDKIIRKYVRFPVELEPQETLQYLIHKLYPERFQYNETYVVEEYYNRILSGETAKFKKGFFEKNEDGKRRAKICFHRMLQMIGPFTDVHQLYDIFSSAQGNKLIAKFKLTAGIRDLYAYPIIVLQECIPESKRDNSYYIEKLKHMKKERSKRESVSRKL